MRVAEYPSEPRCCDRLWRTTRGCRWTPLSWPPRGRRRRRRSRSITKAASHVPVVDSWATTPARLTLATKVRWLMRPGTRQDVQRQHLWFGRRIFLTSSPWRVASRASVEYQCSTSGVASQHQRIPSAGPMQYQYSSMWWSEHRRKGNCKPECARSLAMGSASWNPRPLVHGAYLLWMMFGFRLRGQLGANRMYTCTCSDVDQTRRCRTSRARTTHSAHGQVSSPCGGVGGRQRGAGMCVFDID